MAMAAWPAKLPHNSAFGEESDTWSRVAAVLMALVLVLYELILNLLILKETSHNMYSPNRSSSQQTVHKKTPKRNPVDISFVCIWITLLEMIFFGRWLRKTSGQFARQMH